MLTLSRKTGETIHIGDDIVITIVRIGEYAVKVGIDAPSSVPVHRSEVYLAIRAESKNQQGEQHA